MTMPARAFADIPPPLRRRRRGAAVADPSSQSSTSVASVVDVAAGCSRTASDTSGSENQSSGSGSKGTSSRAIERERSALRPIC